MLQIKKGFCLHKQNPIKFIKIAYPDYPLFNFFLLGDFFL